MFTFAIFLALIPLAALIISALLEDDTAVVEELPEPPARHSPEVEGFLEFLRRVRETIEEQQRTNAAVVDRRRPSDKYTVH